MTLLKSNKIIKMKCIVQLEFFLKYAYLYTHTIAFPSVGFCIIINSSKPKKICHSEECYIRVDDELPFGY